VRASGSRLVPPNRSAGASVPRCDGFPTLGRYNGRERPAMMKREASDEPLLAAEYPAPPPAPRTELEPD